MQATTPETPELRSARKELARIDKLLFAAELRLHESWDKPYGVQDRIERTCRKHRATVTRLERRLNELQSRANDGREQFTTTNC